MKRSFAPIPSHISGVAIIGFIQSPDDPRLGYVLGERVVEPKHFDDGVREYVTWNVFFDGGEWHATTGHYFGDFTAARVDFIKRASTGVCGIREEGEA